MTSRPDADRFSPERMARRLAKHQARHSAYARLRDYLTSLESLPPAERLAARLHLAKVGNDPTKLPATLTNETEAA